MNAIIVYFRTYIRSSLKNKKDCTYNINIGVIVRQNEGKLILARPTNT
jgi:hypothetical protein